MKSETYKTAEADVVPKAQKLAYALGGPVDIWAVWIPIAIAFQLFNMEMKIAPKYIGLIILCWRLWDGVADPIMGWISDNTRTRWGRRRPFVFVGAILTGCVFPLVFWFPENLSDKQVIIWVICFGILLYSCFTVWAMPYQSMLMEMTPDYNERTRAASWRGIAQAISSIVVAMCWYIALYVSRKFTGEESVQIGMRYVSLGIGFLIIILGVIPALFVHERYYEHNLTKKQVKINILTSLKRTLTNREFVLLCLFTVFYLVGTTINESYGRYVGTYYVLETNWDMAAKFQIYGAFIYTACSLSLIPLYRYLSTIYGKDKVLFVSVFILVISALSTWITFTPTNPWFMLINSVFMGAGYAGVWLMIPSMQADVVDHDELKTGDRREGSFASIYSWSLKLSYSFAFFISAYLVEWTGFDAELEVGQPANVYFNLRICYVLVPLVCLVIAIVLLKKYSITPQEARRIRNELEAKRGKI